MEAGSLGRRLLWTSSIYIPLRDLRDDLSTESSGLGDEVNVKCERAGEVKDFAGARED